jgi:hypothetical protein
MTVGHTQAIEPRADERRTGGFAAAAARSTPSISASRLPIPVNSSARSAPRPGVIGSAQQCCGSGRVGDGNLVTAELHNRSQQKILSHTLRPAWPNSGSPHRPTHQTGSSAAGKYFNHVSGLLQCDDEPLREDGHARPRDCRVRGFR